MEVGEDGRHFKNMTTKFQTGDIVKMKTCKKIESKDADSSDM